MSFILGKKVEMTQLWQGDKVIPVTVVKAEPNTVALVRTKERDGYEAVQLQLGKTKCEFRGSGDLKVGDTVTVETFKEGDGVRVSGTSKGRGFQGTVKRHGFHGGPSTHGQKNRQRAPGSIGNTSPQRVIPGRRMAGHMGVDRVTQKKMSVAKIDKESNLIFIKGGIPGARGSLVEIVTAK